MWVGASSVFSSMPSLAARRTTRADFGAKCCRLIWAVVAASLVLATFTISSPLASSIVAEENLLEVLKVPATYRGMRLVYYDEDREEFDVNQELQIEYDDD